MTNIKDIEKEIAAIKERNKKVETDKAWEISWTRKILIAILTYFILVVFFYFAGLPNPFINSIVPTIAFLSSTFSLSYFKKIWQNYIYKR